MEDASYKPSCLLHWAQAWIYWEEEDLIDAARCSTDTLGLLDVVLGL